MQRAAKKLGGCLQNSVALKLNGAAERSGLASSKDATSQKCRLVKINPAIDSCIAKISFALEYCVLKVLDPLNIDA